MEKSEMSIVARHMAKAPVDLEAIFAELGINYEKLWMDDGASGAIARNGDDFTIAVNGLESATRQRFTAAHELAHYLFHRDLMGDGKKMQRHVDRLYSGEQPGDVMFNRSHEIEANRIAAQIVMPKKLVEEKFAETPNAAALAAQFGVSKAAMEIRLKTLGLVPPG